MPTTSEPKVLLLGDLAEVLRTSPRSIKRRMAAGTFPIRPLRGIDSKHRWAVVDVERFLATGQRAK